MNAWTAVAYATVRALIEDAEVSLRITNAIAPTVMK
jgi:hypothetical protein